MNIENYVSFKRTISALVKPSAEKDRLLELNERQFRLASRLSKHGNSSSSISEGRPGIPPGVDCDDFSHALEFEMAFMFAKMRDMTPQEAKAYANQVLAEAEAAATLAEKLVQEAEAAEAEAAEAEAAAAKVIAMEASMSRKKRKTRG